MSSVRTAALLIFGVVLCLGVSGKTASGQSLATASKSAEFSVFGGYMAASTDYGPHTLNGYGAGIDFTVFPRFILKPSLELRGDIANNGYVTEKTVVVGPRAQLDIRQRFHPYGELLFGAGEILYHPVPYPDYTGDRSRVYAYGGGLDIDVTRHFGAKFDFQERNWNLGGNGNLVGGGTYTLEPRTFLVGVIYTIPFRTFKRQSDFR
jgi:hypothetical protein